MQSQECNSPVRELGLYSVVDVHPRIIMGASLGGLQPLDQSYPVFLFEALEIFLSEILVSGNVKGAVQTARIELWR